MRFFRGLIPILTAVAITATACAGDSPQSGSALGSAPAKAVQEEPAGGTTATAGPERAVDARSESTDTPALPTLAIPSPTKASKLPRLFPARGATVTPFQPDPTETEAPTATVEPSATQAPTEPIPPTLDPALWGDLPVIPELSPRALEILADGLARGNNPRAFSKIGDCESQATWFLNDFDLGPEHYALGEYEGDLAPVIEYYAGSFKRTSLAARPGFTAASLMSPIWSDRTQCEKNETPLACEIRVHRPLVAFVLVGTNDATNPKTFEGHLRKALDYTISQGVLPILGTKADNIEGDHAINQTMARVADEYGIPLWNYWAAVQDLPGNGLQPDGAHLTFATPRFDNPANMKNAWPVRNLNALQVLREVMVETE